MAINPVELSLDDAKKVVEEGLDAGFKENRLFIDGDHWQGGAGWIGPRPKQSEAGYAETMNEIRRAFTSKNAIAEVLGRHRNGVLGHEPGWTLVPKRPMKADEAPTDAEATVIAEGNAILTEWWDKRNAHGILGSVIENVLYSSRGVLRLFVPPSAMETEEGEEGGAVGTISADDPLQAALLIFPEAPLPEQATVVVDPNSKEAVGVLALEDDDKKINIEVVFLRTAEEAAAAETPVDAEGAPMTAIRTFGEGKNEAVVDIPLGGRLTMMQMSRRPLITEQVRSMQRALNLALSMVPRNVVTGGFLERILTNAQMPGEWVKGDDGVERFKPYEFPTGAGTTLSLVGLQHEDEATGKLVTTTPGVHFREPVPVTSSKDAKDTHYADILDSVGQRHVLMGSDATASGYSREQARADFEDTLKDTLIGLVPMGRWLLETVLALVEWMTNQQGRWTAEYRIEFRPFVDTGPLTADEIRVDNDSVKEGTIALETALQRRGVTDIDAEVARIMAQPGAQLALLERQLKVVNQALALGMTLEAAGEMAGMTDEDIGKLREAQVELDRRRAEEEELKRQSVQNRNPAAE